MEDDSHHHHQHPEFVHFHVKGMESVLATVSGYHGAERFNLIRLISHSGASYVGNMNPSVTHLVCWKFEGRKYELAKKFKMMLVNHRWIEECVRKGRRVLEKPYTFQSGEEVGPLRLDIQLEINVAKTQSKALKKPAIDIGCEDTSYGAWMDSIHFDELDKATTSRPANSHRVKKRNSTSVKPQLKGARLVKKHMSSKDGLLTSSMVEDCDEIKTLTGNSSSIILSDSPEAERHHHIPDKHTSDRSCFLSRQDNSDANDAIKEIEHVNDENQKNASFPDAPSSVDVDATSKGLPASSELSCVICWTDFCSTRGVLPCGHRFCFSCIQNWVDHMASRGKPSTCPLCKSSFTCITKLEGVVSSDQKIYSQSYPHDSSNTDLYILPDETHDPFGPPINNQHRFVADAPIENPRIYL
ncbi:hypothetical protein OROGR_007806 [Orobanche gracilis]